MFFLKSVFGTIWVYLEQFGYYNAYKTRIQPLKVKKCVYLKKSKKKTVFLKKTKKNVFLVEKNGEKNVFFILKYLLLIDISKIMKKKI